ncbi:MAG: Bro-N domain-containing protein [Bacteroides sp.]
MNKMQVFNYGEQSVRTLLIDEDPWWVLRDVCRVLGIKRTDSTARKLDDDEKGTHPVSTLRGEQNMLVVNESGLYSVILRSDKPEAKAFKRWVTHEVLPAIRKTGSYSMLEVEREPSVETGLQRAGLIIRAAEHRAVPQSEQLRLLDMAIRDLTGKGLDLTPNVDTRSLPLMELPEVTGVLKKGKTKKLGRSSVQLYTVQEIADMLKISTAEFNSFADTHCLKGNYNGEWIRVQMPQGDAREYVYLQSVIGDYREGEK